MLIGFKVCIFKIARKYWEIKREISIYCEILDNERVRKIFVATQIVSWFLQTMIHLTGKSSYFISLDIKVLPKMAS